MTDAAPTRPFVLGLAAFGMRRAASSGPAAADDLRQLLPADVADYVARFVAMAVLLYCRAGCASSVTRPARFG